MASIKKRLVFYCHGYDPEADRRYRRLFVTGFAQLARRFRITRKISPVVVDEAIPSERWTVTAGTPAWQTETTYEVMRWADLVQGDFARGWLQRIPLLFAAVTAALRSALVQRMFRLNWRFTAFILYPWAALFLTLAAAFAVGCAVVALISLAVALPAVVRWAAMLGITFAIMHALGPRIRKAYIYHLLDAWVFTWEQASGRRPEFNTRLDRFARRIIEVARQSDADEILIIGHSTGSTLAVSLAVRVLDLDPDIGRTGPPLALMTIGTFLPTVGFLRDAERLRRDVARLAVCPSLLWVEYQAPQDVLNAYGFEPVRDLGLDLGAMPQVNPKIRSARFKETLTPTTYRKIRWNFFRVHFHFLMTNEIPGEYDFLMIACGPVSLADRIADPQGAVRAVYGPQSGDDRADEPQAGVLAAAGPA